MARGRPQKKGLDYFPFCVDFFSDEKVGAISGEFGIKGEIITVKLLCAIYRNGYYALWDEALEMSLLNILPGISLELLERVVYRLVKWGFFEQDLFSTAKVLTSKGIQRRYFEAAKRRGNINGEMPYLLINVCNKSINVCNKSINVCNKSQRKDNNKYYPNHSKEKDITSTNVQVISTSDKSDPGTVDFKEFADYFNTTVSGTQIPQIRLLTIKRKAFIMARCREYGRDAIYDVVRRAAESDFLNGSNQRAWTADFDWIFRPNNFPKVLEGNYNNRQHGNNNQRPSAEQRRTDAANLVTKFLAENDNPEQPIDETVW